MRIVALSGQDGFLPEIPAADLPIVAGDVCPDRIGQIDAYENPEPQKAWFDDVARPWLAKAPAQHRILTWGNHDFCGHLAHHSGNEVHILADELSTLTIEGRGHSVGEPVVESVWRMGGNAFIDLRQFLRRFHERGCYPAVASNVAIASLIG